MKWKCKEEFLSIAILSAILFIPAMFGVCRLSMLASELYDEYHDSSLLSKKSEAAGNLAKCFSYLRNFEDSKEKFFVCVVVCCSLILISAIFMGSAAAFSYKAISTDEAVIINLACSNQTTGEPRISKESLEPSFDLSIVVVGGVSVPLKAMAKVRNDVPLD